MSAWDVLISMDGASDADLEMVQRRLGQAPNRSARRFGMRVLLAAAVSAALLLATLGIAMAASPQLREQVYQFFHITVQEPHGQAQFSEEPIQIWEHLEIESAAEIDCYTLKEPFYPVADDIFYHWDEKGSCFYQLTDGGFEEISTTRTAFDINYGGAVQHIVYDWAKRDGSYLLGWREDVRMEENPYGYGWTLCQPDPGSRSVWMILPDWGQSFAPCPLLLDLETGAWADVMQEMEFPRFDAQEMFFWRCAPDLRHLLLCGESGAWLYDAEAHTETDLSDKVIGFVYDADFLDPETVVLVSNEGTLLHFAWYDWITGDTVLRSDLMDDGAQRPGSLQTLLSPTGQNAIAWNADNTSSMLDLRTGIGTPLPENLTQFPIRMQNKDGTKLLCVQKRTDRGEQTIFPAFRSFAVCDLERRTVVQLDRAQLDGGDEYMIGWLDAERFAVWAENAADGYSDVRVYRLRAPKR